MRVFTRNSVDETVPAINGEPSHRVQIGGFTRTVADYDVINRDQFGASTIRVTYREITTDNNLLVDGEKVEATPSKEGELQGIAGASFTIKQAPDGAVWGIDGLNAVQQKILDSTPLSPAERAAMTKVMSSLASEEALKKMLGTPTDSWPNYPIRAGESWNYSYAMPAGSPMQLTLQSRRTLKSLDADIASLSETATYNDASMKFDLPGDASGGKMALTMNDMTGAITGYARVQRSSGVALQSSLTQNISGTVAVKVRDGDGNKMLDMRVPMKVTTETRIVMEPR